MLGTDNLKINFIFKNVGLEDIY